MILQNYHKINNTGLIKAPLFRFSYLKNELKKFLIKTFIEKPSKSTIFRVWKGFPPTKLRQKQPNTLFEGGESTFLDLGWFPKPSDLLVDIWFCLIRNSFWRCWKEIMIGMRRTKLIGGGFIIILFFGGWNGVKTEKGFCRIVFNCNPQSGRN